MTVPSSPLQDAANARLLLFQPQHPGAKEQLILARHVFDVFLTARRLISGSDYGPGDDTEAILACLSPGATLEAATASAREALRELTNEIERGKK